MLLRTIIFVPGVLAPVSISLAWRKILEQGGVLNQILNIDFSWLSSVQLAIWIVIFVSIWQWMGYNLLILYAGLQSLDIQTLEAADMDGASWTRKIFGVVIPSIVPTIVLNVIINVISAFRVFDIVYVLTRGGPVHNSEVLTTLMYYYSFSANGPNKMGVGSAIAMVLFLVMVAFGVIRTSLLRRGRKLMGRSRSQAAAYGIVRKRDKGFYVLSRVAMAVGIIGIAFPILYILSLSLRTKETMFSAYLFLIPKAVTLQNYANAWTYAKTNLHVTFLQMFRNSLVASVSSIAVAIALAALASFSFSHFRFRGKELLFTVLIGSFIIPAQVLLIPLFFILKTMGLIDTYLAIILPYVGILIPIATLILRSFFEEIPARAEGIRENRRRLGPEDLPESRPAAVEAGPRFLHHPPVPGDLERVHLRPGVPAQPEAADDPRGHRQDRGRQVPPARRHVFRFHHDHGHPDTHRVHCLPEVVHRGHHHGRAEGVKKETQK